MACDLLAYSGEKLSLRCNSQRKNKEEKHENKKERDRLASSLDTGFFPIAVYGLGSSIIGK